MYHQYMNVAQQTLGYMSSDELKDLLNDDEKLEQKVNDSVSHPSSFSFFRSRLFH